MGLGLVIGYRQLGDGQAVSAFVTAGALSAIGLTGLIVAIWLLFDEHVSKPIEALAAGVRSRTHADVADDIETDTGKYLGDLAPALHAIHTRLRTETHAKSQTVLQRTARLEGQHAQLLQILSDIPVAVIVANKDHQIVLYDGQAADLMEREHPARLNAYVFDYIDEKAIHTALAILQGEKVERIAISVKGHSGALYTGHLRLFGGNTGYTLMLEPLTPDAARPLVYDFDLLDNEPAQDLNNCVLRDLSFVVFDSETTGLDPENDAVVQLGAVRIVNGKIVSGEVFDTMVNPGRPIPPASTKVHHIRDTMVADAPGFEDVCHQFHKFAQGAVIVAHNAPFDMAFLRRQTAHTSLSFDNPVLDTVHLSAVVFGGSAVHTLDALCARLNVIIPDKTRHTAHGDAIATAQALVKLIPILEARGLRTYREVREEAQKHRRILTLNA